MTITIRKLHLAIAVLAVVLIAPATAVATHVFADVPDGAFYADPVEWAFNNEITTGKSPTSFAPLDSVTRGESVTFLQRYDDNVVQPSLDALGALGSGAGVNFAGGQQELQLPSGAVSVRSVDLVAPAAGYVVVTASGTASLFDGDDSVYCSITDGAVAAVGGHQFAMAEPGTGGGVPFSSTRTFAVAAGSTTFRLVCLELFGDVSILNSEITALYVPNLYAP